MSDTFTLQFPTKIIFGDGCLDRIGPEVGEYGGRALLVMGKRAMRETGAFDRAAGLLDDAQVEVVVFDGVESEPSLERVGEGISRARERACDVVIGLGGGSVVDAAKAIAALVLNDGSVEEYHQGKKIERPGLPFIAVPTTAGTGAEVTKNGVLTDPQRKIKRSIRSHHMLAKEAIVDPELTATVPPEITAITGMDAFTQAVEAYVSKAASPVTDAMAYRAVQLIFEHLPKAVSKGQDPRARNALALGSLLSGLAFSNAGLGAAHGLSHPIGALYSIPHGTACTILLPHVMRFNLPARVEKYSLLADAMGQEGDLIEEKAQKAVEAIEGLIEQVGIPKTFRELGRFDLDVRKVISDSRGNSMSLNPREPSDEDLRSILTAAMGR